MPKYPPQEEIVRRIKESAERKLGAIAKSFPAAIARKDAEAVHNHVRAAASSCLKAAMVYARHDRNYALAQQYCSRCADYADTLVDTARQGLMGTPWSGFYVLYCSLLAGRFDKAQQVAQWMVQCPVVAQDAADPHDPLAMLSGYAVLDLREKFENYRHERYDTSWHATHPFFGPLSVYLDLWQAILSRDQAAFDAAMERREDHCVRLARQKDEGRLEFGGGEDSKYIVDFMGIGCAIVARRHGMTCDVDTTYLPRAMVDLASG
jgi:hypothetical protein